jgi:hypothetical protein
LAQVLFGQIPRPRGQRSDVPKDLDRVCMKLLERDPKDRYLNAESAIADLMKCTGAPRAGRDELVALLAARFPNDAPRRGSQGARPSSQTPNQMAAAAAPRPPSFAEQAAAGPVSAMTVRGRAMHPSGENQVLPDVPAPNNAPTRTSVGDARPAMPMYETSAPPRRKKLIGVAAGAIVAVAVAVVLLLSSKKTVATSTSQSTPEPIAAASPVSSLRPAAVPARPTIDAASAVTIDAKTATVVDAASAAKTAPVTQPLPGHEATPDKPTVKAVDPSKKYGILKVTSDPPCDVLVNGRKVGTTYLERKLPVGKVKITLINDDRKVNESFVETINENKPTNVSRTYK